MYELINKSCYFYENIDGVEFTDPFISDFYKFKLRKIEVGTLKKYITPIHKFWIYNLYIKPHRGNTTSLRQYLYEYQDITMEKGFSIKTTIEIDGISCSQTLYDFEKKSDTSDFAALKEYYAFIFDETINPNYHLIENDALDYNIYTSMKDLKKLDKMAEYSNGSSYGLKARGLSRYLLAPTITIFDSMIKSKKRGKKNDSTPSYSKIKAMPIEMFNALLQVTNSDRKRLLYLLCGGASARESQALCLTKYDVLADTSGNNEHIINLINPKSDDVPKNSNGVPFRKMLGRRDFLWENYNIDFEIGSYKYVGFKYPIPSRGETDRTLLFLPINNYEELFYNLYFKHIERTNINLPFVFQTSTPKLLLPSQAAKELTRDIEKIKERFPEFRDIHFIKGGFHAMRHMYGQTMAELAYHYQDLVNKKYKDADTLPNMVERIKGLTMKKMGHSTPGSTDIYFKRTHIIEKGMIEMLKKSGNEAFNYQRFLYSQAINIKL